MKYILFFATLALLSQSCLTTSLYQAANRPKGKNPIQSLRSIDSAYVSEGNDLVLFGDAMLYNRTGKTKVVTIIPLSAEAQQFYSKGLLAKSEAYIHQSMTIPTRRWDHTKTWNDSTRPAIIAFAPALPTKARDLMEHPELSRLQLSPGQPPALNWDGQLPLIATTLKPVVRYPYGSTKMLLRYAVVNQFGVPVIYNLALDIPYKKRWHLKLLTPFTVVGDVALSPLYLVTGINMLLSKAAEKAVGGPE